MLILVQTEHLILSESFKMHNNNKIKIIYQKEQIEISSATVFYRKYDSTKRMWYSSRPHKWEEREADLTCSTTYCYTTVITGTSQHELGQCLASATEETKRW